MPIADWQGTPHVRIYSTLARDHRAVWRSDALLAGYVRLLMVADQAWPGPAPVPRWVSQEVLDALVEEEVIDIEDDLYHFHGLDEERRGRQRAGHAGGLARSMTADRDSLGRFAGGSLDPSSANGDESLDADAGDSRWRSVAGPADPASQPDSQPAMLAPKPAMAGATSRTREGAREEAPARREAPRHMIYCEHYDDHRASHRWIDGIGWKCVICERAKADAETDAGLTFSEKVRRAGEHIGHDDPF